MTADRPSSAPRVIGTSLFLTGLAAAGACLKNKHSRETRRERRMRILFALYRIASEAHSTEPALEALRQEMQHMLMVNVAFFLPQTASSMHVEPKVPENLSLTDAEREALDQCWNDMHAMAGGNWRFEPMIAAAGKAGVLGIMPTKKMKMDSWLAGLLSDIAMQTAVILHQLGLKHSREESRVYKERENLRTMLLSSVSHDFKTPLAGIIGALSVYRSLGNQLSEQKRDALVETAIDEAHRLDSFITNILDMARLGSDEVRLRKEWRDAEGMIEGVVRRMHMRCRHHALAISPCPIGIEVYADIMMVEQVLQNILDNACKYTEAGTRIEIRSRVEEGQGFICEIRDFGAGIPPENMESIFNKYTRLHKKDSVVAGTGLGLAIAKAIMTAQGGWITAANHPGGGALFTLCLPQWRESGQSGSIRMRKR